MPDSEIHQHLVSRLADMREKEAIASLKLIQKLPHGKQATKKFVNQLLPKERKMINRLVYGAIGIFDVINYGLESMTYVFESAINLLP